MKVSIRDLLRSACEACSALYQLSVGLGQRDHVVVSSTSSGIMKERIGNLSTGSELRGSRKYRTKEATFIGSKRFCSA